MLEKRKQVDIFRTVTVTAVLKSNPIRNVVISTSRYITLQRRNYVGSPDRAIPIGYCRIDTFHKT